MARAALLTRHRASATTAVMPGPFVVRTRLGLAGSHSTSLVPNRAPAPASIKLPHSDVCLVAYPLQCTHSPCLHCLRTRLCRTQDRYALAVAVPAAFALVQRRHPIFATHGYSQLSLLPVARIIDILATPIPIWQTPHDRPPIHCRR